MPRDSGKAPTLKSSEHWSRGKREIIVKTVMTPLSFCTYGLISKISRPHIRNKPTSKSIVLVQIKVMSYFSLLRLNYPFDVSDFTKPLNEKTFIGRLRDHGS